MPANVEGMRAMRGVADHQGVGAAGYSGRDVDITGTSTGTAAGRGGPADRWRGLNRRGIGCGQSGVVACVTERLSGAGVGKQR